MANLSSESNGMTRKRPASKRRYLQLDVFADRPGAGNPLGVILDADGLDSARMQALAAWLNLSETVFFVPVTESAASYHVRIFTPRAELPFAGHPSVGAAWAATNSGLATPRNGELVQQCGAGLLPVRVDGDTYTVRSPRALRRDTMTPMLPASLAATAKPGCVPELWNNGPDWWLLEARDEASLRALQADASAIATQLEGGKAALFAFAKDANAGHQLVVRAFAPGVGVPEDPVTGSANALIGNLLDRHGRLPSNPYTSSQGRELGRDGKVQVRVDAEGDVWIGGEVQCVIEGSVQW